MPRPATPSLTPGTVLRTSALRRWGSNPTRLARRLEREGLLQRLGHGLLYVPRETRWGPAPPSEEALLEAFFDGSPYVVTGPERWSPLGLGSTALFVHALVYNTTRSGPLHLGGRTFVLRRVAFPREVTTEWFVVDLFEHSASVGLDPVDLTRNLRSAMAHGRFDRERLLRMAEQFGSRASCARIRSAIEGGGA